MSDQLPNILIVDDENGTSFEAALSGLARTRARHPSEVEVEDLHWADLVLMDYIIKNWPSRDALDELGLQPPNGLALAAVLREHVDSGTAASDHNYTAFAVHTAHIGDISKRLQTTSKAPHIVARLNNLEWAFDKADGTRFAREAVLAAGVRSVSSLAAEGAVAGLEELCKRLLGLPGDREWTERALDDVQLCQAPVSALSAGTSGLTFIRWLAHTILPFPTFLWDEHWVALRLRISVKSLRRVLEIDCALARELQALQYEGVLAGFLGTRWWRSAVEQFAWRVRAEGAATAEDFHVALENLAEFPLDRVTFTSPVVCVTRDLAPSEVVESLEKTVRLVPDLWPPYADTAHAEVEQVRKDDELRALVHPLDRQAVDDDQVGEK